jgi:flavin-dependent dehydrogenase
VVTSLSRSAPRRSLETPRHVDVAVIGGGCAGSSAALALVRDGCSTLLIDRSARDEIRAGEILPPAIRKPLLTLGLWEQFIRDDHLPSSGIYSAWGRAELHDNNFIFNPYGSGWHVDRTRLHEMLLRSVEHAGARVWRGGELLRCTADTEGTWDIEVDAGDERRRVTARFVIDATGRVSRLARRLGARRISFDRLIGTVAFVDAKPGAASRDNYMVVEAVDSGWWYSAWLPGSRLVIAYMTDPDMCPSHRKGRINHWKAQLEKAPHTLARIGGSDLEPDLFVYPANSSRLDRPVGSNWLAVGDAAAAFDPLSAQGIYKALDAGLMAARSIHELWSGHSGALRNYGETVARSFRDYLVKRDEYYARERRWTSSTFWKRRHVNDQRRQRPTNLSV